MSTDRSNVPFPDPRTRPPTQGNERNTLLGFLGWHRHTLEVKCAGLDAEAMARRSVEPSTMSLLGLVRHLADVERTWFRQILDGQDAPPRFRSRAEPDMAFDGATGTTEAVAEAWEAWRSEVAFADRFVAEAPDLDVASKVPYRDHGPMSLRWVLVHLVEEYARHNGHVDLLRQRIDVAVGE